MNLSTREEIANYLEIFQSLVTSSSVDITLAPQMPLLSYMGECIHHNSIHLATQNLHWETKGAFTGESSPLLLEDLGVKYAIIGHGERRSLFGETDETVNKKIITALAHGIRPILCIGETLAQREAGQTMQVLQTQLSKALDQVDMTQVDIAYEPLWSIGTGKIPSTEEIEEVHTFIRSFLQNTQSRILYGGSANEKNAADLIRIPEVNGFLVGGASLNPETFAMMAKIIDESL